MSFGLINGEADRELQIRLGRHATAETETAPNSPEFKAEVLRLRELYPALLWGRREHRLAA